MLAELLTTQAKNPAKTEGAAFAPSNIALIKYWGKRDLILNLPMTNSLSISLGSKGAHTRVRLNAENRHNIFLNGKPVDPNKAFYRRLAEFLNSIKPKPNQFYDVETLMNLPVAAGLASSACGFAALVKAFADLYAWSVPNPILSILCRMGSGSACRSLWQGFVEWHAGERPDGLDSFAVPLPFKMPNLVIGLCILSTKEKPISSREAMRRTVETSTLYEAWPKQVMEDLVEIKVALQNEDFIQMGQIAEHNALAMHATMLSAKPGISYFLPETIAIMHTIWKLRSDGINVFFTEDAGPNIKIIARKEDMPTINEQIGNIEWLRTYPFNGVKNLALNR